MLAGAINTLCASGLFDEARQLAGSNSQLLQHVEERRTQHLVASNNADELAARGNAAAALEMYSAQGNWERTHQLVSEAFMYTTLGCLIQASSISAASQISSGGLGVLALQQTFSLSVLHCSAKSVL